MFNFGRGGWGGCSWGDGDGGLWSCLINLIILFIVLEFLCNIITGGLNCGDNRCPDGRW
jgi:hypothetical protein